MDTFQAIKKRRSVKHYKRKHKMTEREVNQLMRMAVLSPTSFNIQNWRFVLVRDSGLREKIKDAAWGQNQFADASLLIILCADLKFWARKPRRYWRNAPKPVQDHFVGIIENYYRKSKQNQRDEAMRSGGIVAQTIMLAAKAMGYDTCPMVGFDFKRVARIIKLPKDHVIAMAVVVGKAARPARPRGGQLPLDEVVVWDRF